MMDVETYHNIICFNLMEVVCAMFIMLRFVWSGWSKFQNELFSSNVSDPGQVHFFTHPHVWFPFILYLKILMFMVFMTYKDCQSYLWCRKGNFYNFWHHLRAQGRLSIFLIGLFVLINVGGTSNVLCLADAETKNSCFNHQVPLAFGSSPSFYSRR